MNSRAATKRIKNITGFSQWIFIVLLSGILRLLYLSTIEFKVDEAVNLFLSTRVLFGHPFPPGATVSSFGILNPPLFLYFLFPFATISTNPQFISGAIAAINALSVGIYYLVVKKYYGKAIAFFSSLLLATSPWAVIFSRKIWAQDLVLPLCVGLIFCVHKMLIDKNEKYWTGAIIFSLFLLQIHQATLFFLAPLFVCLAIYIPEKPIKFILFGILIGIVPLLPYIFFEASHKFLDIFFVAYAVHRVSSVRDGAVFIRPLQIINQGNFRYLFGDDIQYFASRFSLLYKAKIIFYVEYILLIFGAILFTKNYPKMRIIVYAIVTFEMLLFILKIPADMHYFIILFPFLFLFLGVAFSYFWRKAKVWKIGTLAIFSLLLLFSSVYIIAFFMLAQNMGHFNGDYGTIFSVNQKISQDTLKRYSKSKEYKEMLLAKYIPLDFMHGNNTVAMMLYNNEQTKKDLQRLDKRLLEVPVDYRIYHQLLSYYTSSIPTRMTLQELRVKTTIIPLYHQIYSESYNDFLASNLTKAYESPLFAFAFEYPRHWPDPTESIEGINLEGNGYHFSFHETNEPCIAGQNCRENLAVENATYKINSIIALHQQVNEVICNDNKNNWCGSLYGPIIIQKKSMLLLVKPGNAKSQPDKSLINIVLSSMREI